MTEITYPFNYYRELNPNIQALALTGAGLTPPAQGNAFSYIELGCGLGLSTLVHAAANPQAQFFAIDLIPEHIAVARGIAAAAGLENVQFLEMTFEDLDGAGLPQFDVIAMHGVWSWINAFNRQVILRFADRHLKSGGAFYASYNAQPGYTAVMPLRELMMIGYREASGSVAEKVAAGLMYSQHIKALGTHYFRANPLVAQYLEDIMPLSPHYLAHEYFNADWWSFYFSEVAAQVAPLGLTFGASAHVRDNIDALNFTPEMREALDGTTETTQRETLKDFFVNRQFRRDMFLRQAKLLPDSLATLMDQPFAAAVLPANVDRVAGTSVLLGEIRPRPDITRAVVAALEAGPASARVLMAHPAVAEATPAAVLDTLLTLAALGAAEPAMPNATLPTRKVRTDRLNMILWERALRGDEVHATASPVTGGAVGLTRAEQLFLLAHYRGTDPVALVAEAMPAQSRDAIALAHVSFAAGRMPLLRNLGIV